MSRRTSLSRQLSSLNEQIGQLAGEMPRLEDCGVASPELIKFYILQRDLAPLVVRRTEVLRRLRFTARRRLEDNRRATAMIFAGRRLLMLRFLSSVALEDPRVAQELGRASGARLCHLLRLHVAPLAEQAAPGAPAPWAVPHSLREMMVGADAPCSQAPGWEPASGRVESLPAIQAPAGQPVPIRELRRRARHGREVA